MKDIAHHKEKFQRKILRDARKKGKAEEKLPEEPHLEETSSAAEAVEIEEIPVLRRPLNRKFH